MKFDKKDLGVSIISTRDIIDSKMIEICLSIERSWMAESEIEDYVLVHVSILYQNEDVHHFR